MPTTCGFPNCKFRSRYRGQEDNRHFYRIPKRPTILRQKWLEAIGRTEATVVSQLRICSGHFSGGEKKDGDIPVPDPEIDTPLCIELPPKEPKGDRKRLKTSSVSSPGGSSLHNSSRSSLLMSPNHHFNKHNHATVRSPLLPAYQSRNKTHHDFSKRQKHGPSGSTSFHNNEQHARNHSIEDLLSASSLSKHMNSSATTSGKPLVALLDGRDCSIEMPHLKDIATVAFCDAQSVQEIHDRVLKEAVAVLMWHTIRLTKDDLRKFRSLRLIVRIGADFDNIDVRSAGESGVAVCNVTGFCIEEVADSTMCMILGLYRKVDAHRASSQMTKFDFWKSNRNHGSNGEPSVGQSGGRIKGQKLGLVGLGAVGVAVAIRAKAFSFDVRFYDPYLPDGVEKSLGIGRYATLHEALQESDCISLHCPLNEHTKNLINDFSLRQMKPGAFLVNTARTELIDELALSKFLKEKRLAGAAIDISGSKMADDHLREIFRDTPNLLCTPNCSWYSPSSYREVREAAAMEIRRALTSNSNGSSGVRHWTENLRNCVNRQFLCLNKQNGFMDDTAQGRNSLTGSVPRVESATAFSPYAHFVAPNLSMTPQQSIMPNNFPFNFLPSTPPYGHHQFFHQASSSSSSSMNNPPRGFMDFLQHQKAAGDGGQPLRSVSPPPMATPKSDKPDGGVVVNGCKQGGCLESPTTSSSSVAVNDDDQTMSPKDSDVKNCTNITNEGLADNAPELACEPEG